MYILYITSPVLQGVLHLKVIKEEGFAQTDIFCGLLQRESFREEGDQTVTDRPLADGLIENSVVCEDDNVYIVIVLQARQDTLHWRSQGLQMRRTSSITYSLHTNIYCRCCRSLYVLIHTCICTCTSVNKHALHQFTTCTPRAGNSNSNTFSELSILNLVLPLLDFHLIFEQLIT